MAMEITFNGDGELLKDFERLTKNYFDYAYNGMKRAGRAYARGLRKQTKESIKKPRTGKITKGFKTTGPKGYKVGDMEVEFSGENKINPHWHLVEEGHRQVIQNKNRWGKPNSRAGQVIRDVAGKHNVEKFNSSGEPEKILEREMLKSLDKAMKDGHFA